MRRGIVRAPTRSALVILILCLMSHAASAAQVAPARKRRPSTGHDEHAAALEFNRRTLVGAYDRAGRRDPKWDEPARAFLDAMAVHFTTSPRHDFYRPKPPTSSEHRLGLGRNALDAGCDDPLVLYCYVVPLELSDRQEALALLRRACEGLKAGKYPPFRVHSAFKRLAQNTPDDREKREAQAVAEDYRVRMFCEKLDDAARRLMLDAVWRDVHDDLGAQQALVAALDERPDADAWVRDVLAGEMHKGLAWESRGSGSANFVTDEGWKGFYHHLGLARDRFARAWKLAPQLPEAPSGMITVAMGGGDELGEKVFDWFERALNAQVDYIPAYERMYLALLPRWGGSHEQLLEVGYASVQTGRYDTLVPWNLIAVLWEIRKDGGLEWSQVLADPEIYTKVVEVAEGYAKAQAKTPRAPWYRTYHAAAAWRAGKLGEARKVLEALGKDAQPSAFVALGAGDGALVISEIYAVTGPHAAEIREANRALAAGDAGASAEKLRALGAKLDDDPATPYVAGLLRVAEWRVQFETGQWVDIQPKSTLAGWEALSGTWRVDGDALAATGDASHFEMMLLWTAVDLNGVAFELAGRVEFPVEPGPGKEAGNGGPAMRSTVTERQSYVQFDRDEQKGCVLYLNKRPITEQVEVHAANDFALRRAADGSMTTEFNGQEVLGPIVLPGRHFQAPMKFGIGGIGRAPVRYTNLRIRKIEAPDVGDAGKPAEGDAVPF